MIWTSEHRDVLKWHIFGDARNDVGEKLNTRRRSFNTDLLKKDETSSSVKRRVNSTTGEHLAEFDQLSGDAKEVWSYGFIDAMNG